MKAQATNQTIIRLPDVKARTGLSRSTIYQLIKEKQLKPPIRLGKRCSGWLASDVDDFIAERVKESRPEAE